MIVLRLKEILEEMNRARPDNDQLTYYRINKETGIAQSTLFNHIKPGRAPVRLINASVCERLLDWMNANRAPNTSEYTLADLLVVTKEKKARARG